MSETPIAIVPTEPTAPTNDALAKVAENLSGLKPKDDPLAVVSGKTLGDVLPQKFYEGAGLLKLTDHERQMLETLQDASDDEIEIRPDGLIYVEHITVRRALSKVFGAEWAIVPGSAIAQDKTEKAVLVCQRWVLLVRGCYVGEAIGAGSYYENNVKQNKTDAAEAAASEAIRRICAKTALGICSNVFQKSTARRWRKQYAIEVWVKGEYKTVKQWRRKDAEPFEGETGPVQHEPTEAERQTAATELAERVKLTEEEAAFKNQMAFSPTAPELEPPKPTTPNEAPKPQPPREPNPPMMVTVGNWRLFMLQCRQKKLVVRHENGEDCTAAFSLLTKMVPSLPMPPNIVGKKQDEILHATFMQLTAGQFGEVILELKKR